MKRISILLVTATLTLFSCGSGSWKEETFYVRGNCGMCKERLESGIKALAGVGKVKYEVKKETMNVMYDTTKISRLTIEQACANLGHSTEAVPMNEKNHEALPECCKVSHNEGKH
jgi:periplasmic mercuric ion binding protein